MKRVLILLLVFSGVTVSSAQELLPPTSLKAQHVDTDSGQFIQLSWQKNARDSVSIGYQVFNKLSAEG